MTIIKSTTDAVLGNLACSSLVINSGATPGNVIAPGPLWVSLVYALDLVNPKLNP